MNIDWVIPCRYVEVHDNLGTIVGAGIDTFWVPEVPAPVQVIFAVRLTAAAEELGEETPHKVRNLITDPQGNEIGSNEGDLAFGSEDPQEDWLNGFVFPAAIQFEATEEGTYTVEQQVDQASVAVPIHVRIGLPPGAPDVNPPAA